MTKPYKLTLTGFAILMVVAVCSSDAMAQRGGGRGGGPRGGGDEARLLNSDAIQKELDITEDQLKELEEMNSSRGMDREKIRAELEGLSDEERREKISKMIEERAAESKQKLEEVLMPQQMDRLEELVFQNAARNGLLNATVVKTLNITDSQKKILTEASPAMEEELAIEIAELKRKKMDKLVKNVLDSEQNLKWEKLTRDLFAFAQRGGQAGRGGDRGGAGGRGGQDNARGGRGGDRGAGGGRGGDRGGARGGDRGGRGGDRGGNDAQQDF
ncbi:MAG: hypothetical protein AB8B55_17830 [Mariniblastus sp.]